MQPRYSRRISRGSSPGEETVQQGPHVQGIINLAGHTRGSKVIAASSVASTADPLQSVCGAELQEEIAQGLTCLYLCPIAADLVKKQFGKEALLS